MHERNLICSFTIPLNLTGQLNDKAAIEIHMENLIKGHQNLWIGYKRRLLQVQRILKELGSQAALSVSESDCSIRFNYVGDDVGLNSLFFVYEIGRVFPNLMWRHLIGSDQRLDYLLLTKTISCLPAFSFSLDQQTTLLYWGERIPFLSTVDLRNLKLSNFVLKANSPSSVEVSAANLVWPRSAYRLMNEELERLAADYLFNSLMPPVLEGVGEVWFESPFVLVGDRIVRFLTIHKTLCTIYEETAKPLTYRGVVNTKAAVIDRNFAVRRIPVEISEKCIDEFIRGEPPYEVIFVKDMRFRYDPTSLQRPYIRYTIYPFESVKLFGGESYGGRLLTIASMVLRERYLRSSDSFFFTITPEEFKWYLNKILSPLSHGYASEQFGLRLVESREGLRALASLLSVYTSDGSSLMYLHPALFECFPSILESQVKKNDLIRFMSIASRYNQKAASLQSVQKVFLIQELFKKEFGSILDYRTATLLRVSLHNLVNICIPLSKALCLYPEVKSYG
jgi:hypothetical protein